MSDAKNGAGEEKQEFSLISNETLLALYRGLLKGRAHGARPGKSGWAFEATAVAVRQDLVAEDTVIGPDASRVSLNGHRAALVRELERAVGSALAQKTKNNGKVTVVYGGPEHGEAWADVLEVARKHRLPMVFVAELQEEEAGRGARKGNAGVELEPGTEMARIIVDGHDVVGSYRVAHEAIERARKDRGPTLIECAAFRVAGRRRVDAVAAMESYLRGKGLLPVKSRT